jgi:hypothetical protein
MSRLANADPIVNIEGRQIWVFGTGNSNRSHQDIFHRWDAILFGPD